MGEWRFVGYTEEGPKDKFTDCDARTVWRFTDEAATPLGDGTAVKKMKATAPEECMHFGFEASWTLLPDGKLFLSTTRMGGVGGSSKAGAFKVDTLDDTRMVLAMFGATYRFERKR